MRLNNTKIIFSALYLLLSLLSACGGGGSTSAGGTASYTVGGTVSGLSGSVVLQNNSGDNLTVSAAGPFTFATKVASGSAYSVTVLTQPAGQSCSVASGTGSIAANVTNVTITCAAVFTFTIGGSVSGLTSSVVLQNNSGDNLTVLADGTFTFATPVAESSPYSVTVLTQPTTPIQTCSVSAGAGTVSASNVTDVVVVCSSITHTIGGAVSGVSGTMVLQVNDGDDLVVTNGAFTFPTPVAESSPYNVTVLSLQFPNQTCTITNGSGTLSGDVTNVEVGCVKNTIPHFAYVANNLSDTVSAYTINATTGVLTSVSAPVATGTNPYSVTVDPSGKFAYVANNFSDDVSAYTIGSTGALTEVAGSPFDAGTTPNSVTVDPTGKFAYVANYDSDNVSAYTINAITGALTPIDANSGAAGIQNFPAGTTPNSVTVDPSGKFAYVVNLGSGFIPGSNNISAYSINAITGALTPIDADSGTAGIQNFPAGTDPVSVTINPSGTFAYVTNWGSNDVSAYTIDGTGALTPIDADSGTPGIQNFPAGNLPSSITVDPSGNFAYVANWGSDDVSAYAIDGTGALTNVAGSPFVAGTGPISVTVDPSGKFAYVANQNSNDVSAYTIDGTGALTNVAGSPFVAGTGPTSVTTTIH